ncbi:MBL fold metallo-hydrolase [Jannaschia sp. M317]|uniref:MBL fold metallo-hydrolase n=1 Tax=Jannaschia sp. M317 TaxID=2867011 RepID=UPI0021A6872E|nr:MBL fold metallo-hydrolase [Jannaschia sp. M317]UWQ16308.1 MBL fold metallo-hydrolase [Jannaschia sp. M317]
MTDTPQVEGFFDSGTNTISYLMDDGTTCAVIDPVLDFDMAAGRTGTDSADRLIAAIRDRGLTVDWLLETHVHADHLSAAPYIQEKLGGKIGIGAEIVTVQETFGKIFNEGTRFQRDGSQFDALFREGSVFQIGTLPVHVLHTPGHTPACLTYVVGKGQGGAAFVGDTMFMPDFGTARCDFPGGSAEVLWESIQKILALPDDTRIFVGHDYKAPGRDDFAWETTVAAEKRNKHLADGRDAFLKMRTERDATLGAPKLILPSLQVNMRGGRMPEPDAEGNVSLKLPVNRL